MLTSLCVSVSVYWEQPLTFILFLLSGKKDAFFRARWAYSRGCTVTELSWWNANRMKKGKLINVRPCHSGLFSRSLSVCMLSIFPPLFVLELLITLVSPLHCIPHSFVILPRKRIRGLSLSHHTFPLSHSAFLCLCPLVVHSAPYCLSTLHFDLRRLWCHTRSKGCWEVTQGWMSSCPASISTIVKCPFFPFRRVLPLFGESVSCFKNSVLPF